jgi:hypothetical protein
MWLMALLSGVVAEIVGCGITSGALWKFVDHRNLSGMTPRADQGSISGRTRGKK